MTRRWEGKEMGRKGDRVMRRHEQISFLKDNNYLSAIEACFRNRRLRVEGEYNDGIEARATTHLRNATGLIPVASNVLLSVYDFVNL